MSKSPTYTYIESIKVNKFRSLENITFELGKRVTVIAGKNGTSKSTILGIIAQIFSYNKDYSTGEIIKFKTIDGNSFKSVFNDHFRLSEKYDKAGDLDVKFTIYDGYFNEKIFPELKFYNSSDRILPRPVVRNNIKTHSQSNTSRNVTHPVIYLSLSRLLPITKRTNYNTTSYEYLEKYSSDFIRLSNVILCKENGTAFTSTKGTINSAVVHSNNYDHQSVSVGEDNVGQIIIALLSFEKLKNENKNYHGGILLIDELDAGLHPSAQRALYQVLNKYSKKLNIQIVFTTHSIILIESYLKITDNSNFKTIYLKNNNGSIEKLTELNDQKILSDLSSIPLTVNIKKTPNINIYFEDDEAICFFKSLTKKFKLKSVLKIKNVKIGCENYIELATKKIDEFCLKSIVVLDGDIANSKISRFKNFIKLPTNLPPDQLLFEFLFNLPANDIFWTNSKSQFSKDVFYALQSVIQIELELKINKSEIINLYEHLAIFKSDENKARQLFKNFYNSTEIQLLLSHRNNENPYNYFLSQNSQIVDDFLKNLTNSIFFVNKKIGLNLKIG